MSTGMDAITPGTPWTLPSPPFIALEGIPNCRDLGGWPISGQADRSIRRNRIFRCGDPTKATEADVEKLRLLGVRSVYDFRSTPEIDKRRAAARGAAPWVGIERHLSPVFPNESYDPASLAASHADYMSEGTEVCITVWPCPLANAARAW
jgi:hypothetical protein